MPAIKANNIATLLMPFLKEALTGQPEKAYARLTDKSNTGLVESLERILNVEGKVTVNGEEVDILGEVTGKGTKEEPHIIGVTISFTAGGQQYVQNSEISLTKDEFVARANELREILRAAVK